MAETLAKAKNTQKPEKGAISPPMRAARVVAIVVASRPSPGPQANVGTGRDTYTMRTVGEYLRRVRAEMRFHAEQLERLARLGQRYERKLQSRL